MPSTSERGSALLAVLATVAVLTAVAFATSGAALGGLDRAALRRESAQAYFLARGGVEAALRELETEVRRGSDMSQMARTLRFEFGSGSAEVRLLPDGAKLNVNRIGTDALAILLESAGAEPADSKALAASIAAYRDRLREGGSRAFWQAPSPAATSSPRSSFRRRSASIQMVEELLSVPGVHPDLIYGSYQPAPGQPLRRVNGLMSYLRTDGPAAVNVNAAPREVLLACGLSASVTDRILAERESRPLLIGDPLLAEAGRQALRVPLNVSSPASGWTLVATGRLHSSGTTRRVTALVKSDSNSATARVDRWFELGL